MRTSSARDPIFSDRPLLGAATLCLMLAIATLGSHTSRAQCLVGSFDAAGNAAGVDVVGTTTYLAAGGAGLLIFDTSDPATPAPLGAWRPNGPVKDVTVVGDIAFLACAGANVDTLSILDVGDPAAPVLIGAFDSPGSGLRLHLVGDTAYIAASLYGGLQIFDVGNPAAPELLATLDLDWPVDVHVAGSVAYLADDGELAIVDVSDPAAPALLSQTWLQGDALGVFARGSTVYVANGLGRGLVVLDASDPGAPAVLGRYTDIPSSARDVVVQGDTAYVAAHLSGLVAIDVSDPASPRLVHVYNHEGMAYGVSIDEPHASVAADAAGLQIFDVAHCPCPPDLNGDGQVNTLDFIVYLGAWSSDDPLADWNGDGEIDSIDFILFLGDWAGGC